MYMEIEQYRLVRLAQDEICVAAAFLDIAGLYGVSARWIQKGDGLGRRVAHIVTALEQKGMVLPEPGGTVWMEPELYGILGCMSRAQSVGRLGFSIEGCRKRLYLYGDVERTAFLEQDGGGECWLGYLPSDGALEWLWTGSCQEVEKEEESDWLGALVFRRFGSCFEPVLDMAWTGEGRRRKMPESEEGTEPESFEQAWSTVCRAFEDNSRREGSGL